MRCNGRFECLGHEDEAGCGQYSCPGFYKCRQSRVCLHGDHVCDGLAQCPRHDDELLCNSLCPQGCVCQGLAFVCGQPFDDRRFSHLRYVDGRSSGMRTSDLARLFYLVYLSLSSCGLRGIRLKAWLNLQTLDLSDNHLTFLEEKRFLRLSNLRDVVLSGNPLISVLKRDFRKRVDLDLTLFSA